MVLSALVATLSLLGPADDLALAKRLSKQYEAALLTRDMSWFRQRTTPDYVNLTPAKVRQSRSVALSEMKSGFDTFKSIKRASVKVTGAGRAEGGLLVYCNVVVTAFLKSKGTPLVEFNQFEEDLWVPNGKAWALKRTITKSNEVKIWKGQKPG